MHQYVNEYCGENLVRITFRGMPNITIEEFQKVFVNVKEAVIDGGKLGQQWSSFVKCFPNVRNLNIERVGIDTRCIKKPLPLLEHLYVFYLKRKGFTVNQIVANLLNGVQQLKSLIMCTDEPVPIDELLTMIKHCPLITSFKYSLCGSRCTPVTSAEVQRIVNKFEFPALINLICRSIDSQPMMLSH